MDLTLIVSVAFFVACGLHAFAARDAAAKGDIRAKRRQVVASACFGTAAILSACAHALR